MAKRSSALVPPTKAEITKRYRSKECGALLASGKICKRFCRPGQTRCPRHGGSSAIKHGLYSINMTANLATLVEESKTNTEVHSLRNEIGLLRGLLSEFIEQNQHNTADPQTITTAAKIVDEIRKTLATLQELEKGLQITITIEQVNVMVNQIVTIVKQEVKDGKTKERLAGRLEDLSFPAHRG